MKELSVGLGGPGDEGVDQGARTFGMHLNKFVEL